MVFFFMITLGVHIWEFKITTTATAMGTSLNKRFNEQKMAVHVCYNVLHISLLSSASWLVCSTPERAVRVPALAGDIVLCFWARHFTLTVPLSTQVYKWVPANLMLGGNPAMD